MRNVQDQVDVVKGIITIFLKDNKEGKKHLIEEEARISVSSEPYEKTEERKGHRNGPRMGKLKTVDGRLELKTPRQGNFH